MTHPSSPVTESTSARIVGGLAAAVPVGAFAALTVGVVAARFALYAHGV
ncbi:hypothetical protein [Siculibacillus lacustris]|nr:hypothetical protein [Siculibacillus lacustris]